MERDQQQRQGEVPGLLAVITRTLFATLLLVSAAFAEIIPSSRRVTWQGNVGVSGGIPTDRTQSGSTIASTGDTTDRAATIQAALDAASPNTYVLLGSGTFVVSAGLLIPDDVTLRGAGPTLTTITNTGNVPLISFYGYQSWEDGTNLVYFASGTGAAKGATSIQLASNPIYLGVGMHVQIQESNDARIVAGIEGDSGDWAMGQWVKITGIDSGTKTYTFTPALYAPYTAANSPRIRFNIRGATLTTRNMLERGGLEDVRLLNTDPYTQETVMFHCAAECWLKNVTVEDGGLCNIWMLDTYRCEIRHSHVKNVLPPYTSSRGYGIQIGTTNGGSASSKTTALLLEDNIFEGNRGQVVIGYGAAGCVVGYNYFTGCRADNNNIGPDIVYHSGFPVFNLAEGNIAVHAQSDMYHGNSWWNTTFRNWLKGHVAGKDSALSALEVDRECKYHNAVGNVLGYSGVVAAVAALGSPGTSVRRADAPSSYDGFNRSFRAMMLGFEGEGGGVTLADSSVAATLIDHGNFDWVTSSQVWETTDTNVTDHTDHTIPNSLYLAGQPSWWTSGMAWPPFNAATGAATDTDIPAGDRYINGAAPALPTFSVHPTSQVFFVGESGSLTVSAAGVPSPTLQWRKDGSNISGATTATLSLSNIQLSDAGSYDCVATNTGGTATSNAAAITVTGPALRTSFRLNNAGLRRPR